MEEKQKRKNKVLLIFLIIFIILFFAASGYIVYDKFFNKKEPIEQKEEKKEETEEKEPEENLPYTLSIPKSEYGYLCKVASEGCSSSLEIPTKTEDAKLLAISSLSNIVLYKDDVLRTYNVKSKKIDKIKLEDAYDAYDIATNEDETEVIGIIYKDGEKTVDYSTTYDLVGFYNIKLDTKLYEDKNYNYIYSISDKYIGATTENEEATQNHLLSTTKEEEILHKYGTCVMYDTEDEFILEKEGCIGEQGATIYTPDKKVLAQELSSNEFSIYNKQLYFKQDNKVVIYNIKGNKVKESSNYQEVLDIIENYVVAVNNNKLIISSLDKDFTKELDDWNDEKYYHYMISGYYKENELSNENEKEAGIYLIVGNHGADSSDSSGIEYYFNPETKEVKQYDLPEIMGYAKPILYLYPEKETFVTVSFKHPENLTTTYPKFKDNWYVKASPNGDLYDMDNNYYYGLYWEENSNHQVDFKTGFYVTKENAISFLEEKLTTIGLNAKERNEFIMYWLPILEKNKQSLVYFELTEERNNYNELIINPQPDSLLRVAIHVKKVNQKVNIKEQKLPQFKRQGFTAVEWGGVLYEK